jgi:threonine dehydrogenase-like Zn-dependent dehydrogenase
MGLLIAVLAQLLGAEEIWVSDPATAKHDVVRAVGVHIVVHPEGLDGERFDIVLGGLGLRRGRAEHGLRRFRQDATRDHAVSLKDRYDGDPLQHP